MTSLHTIDGNKAVLANYARDLIIKVGFELTWLWVAVERESKEIIGMSISRERNVFVAEQFLSDIVNEYGEHLVSTDDVVTWYLQACKFLKLKHHLHSSYEKSIIERIMQYVKDRTIECFNDYFPCKRRKSEMDPYQKSD